MIAPEKPACIGHHHLYDEIADRYDARKTRDLEPLLADAQHICDQCPIATRKACAKDAVDSGATYTYRAGRMIPRVPHRTQQRLTHNPLGSDKPHQIVQYLNAGYGIERMPDGTPCKTCHRPMHHRENPHQEGMVRHHARGECYSCGRGNTPRKFTRIELGDPCKHCQRPMYPKKLGATPGHVAHQGNGVCGSCARGNKPRDVIYRITAGDPCRDCGHPIAPQSSPQPGMRTHQGRGLCSVCRYHDRKDTECD